MTGSIQEKKERLRLLDKVIQNFGFENEKTIFFAKVVENSNLPLDKVNFYYQKIMN